MNVKVEIFDDRIEIESPGLLVKSMTVEEMKIGRSIPRNPMIAQLFQDTHKTEKWGSGISRAIVEVEKYGLPDIRFAEQAGQVIATIFVDVNKPKGESTDSATHRDYQPIDKSGDKIVDYLKTNDSIKSGDAQELLRKSATATRKVLEKLEAEGKIIAEGANRGRKYRLK
jgi:predicted HTH transcriptional regulator